MMRERADIICMNCGRTLGEVEQQAGSYRIVDGNASTRFRLVRGQLLCLRCGGRGFVEGRMLASA
jgi:hypothetical protein